MASFTANPNFDKENSNPKDWAYHLGCLPNSHHIVFTKSDLIQFLKQHNVHVGPNFTELAKLPKYATVGKLTESTAPVPSHPPSASTATPASRPTATEVPTPIDPAAGVGAQTVYLSSGEAFRPTRRVRELAGGGSAQISALFGSDGADEQDAPPSKPIVKPSSEQAHRDAWDHSARLANERRASPTAAEAVPAGKVQQPYSVEAEAEESNPSMRRYEGVPVDANSNGFRPTRRVRVPGGTGGLSSISFE